MLSLTLIFCTFLAHANSIRSLCYFDNSAQYRTGMGTYKPENIDPMLCNHIVYSYVRVDDLDVSQVEWNDQISDKGMYFDVLKLRDINPNLKVLLAVGRFMETADIYLPAVHWGPTVLLYFAKKVVAYARDRTFDGVSLEWANLAASRKYKKGEFFECLKAIRWAVNDDSYNSGKTRLILAVTVPAKKHILDTEYPIRQIIQESDFITVRAFDMRTASDGVVGLSSAFLSAPNATGDDMYLSVKWVADYYTSMGIPKDKVNIGISTYGRTFQLKDEQNYQIGDAAVNDGNISPWSMSPGMVGHYEICQAGGEVFDVPEQGGRFLVDGVNWISYEDTLSVIQKACFIKQEGFGGIAFWTLDLDDFSGQGCREGKYPIITTALRVMSSPDMSLCALLNSTNYVKALSANTTEPTTPPAPADSGDKMRVVCYYERWAYYRREAGRFVPEDINPDLCTHIVYAHAFLKGYNIIRNNSMETQEPWRDGLFGRFVNARKRNPALKVLLGVISGIDIKYYYWPILPQEPSTYGLRSMARNALRFIKKHGFDGIEITWTQHTNEQKSVFLHIFQAFKWAMDEDASLSGGSRLILSVVMPADKDKIDVYGNGIKAFEEAADFLSISTNDYHGRPKTLTDFHSPLFAAIYETGHNMYLNLDWVAKYYVSLGVSKRKINLGIPTYARTYTLLQNNYHGRYNGAKGVGIEGEYTGEPGLLAFYEVCEFIALGARIVRFPERSVQYAFLGDQWISFEDVGSVGEKACYARQHGFGGVVVWAMDLDDFVGMSCGKGKYPLLSSIYNTTQNFNPNCRKSVYDGWELVVAVDPSLLHSMNFNLSMRMLLYGTSGSPYYTHT